MPIGLCLMVGLVLVERAPTIETPEALPVPVIMPDFSTYTDVRARKQAFFDYMLPLVRNANAAVAAERRFLLRLREKLAGGITISKRDSGSLLQLADKYLVDSQKPPPGMVADLIKRVDTIPASLVLAQAANESAWGTSRFARQGKNVFGIWCFRDGCGKVPNARDPGKRHEVASFDSVQDGVSYYLLLLNTHPAYAQLRSLRDEKRRVDEKPTGATLAEGLLRYSERGGAYVRELQAMIRVNQLQRYTIDHFQDAGEEAGQRNP
ncbi:MAG: glucosaminidase domain-containing protein [Proteobacteria bacterium]|nr:glucosaminidase domain-containing protein [Pseudomonadota bacterium]